MQRRLDVGTGLDVLEDGILDWRPGLGNVVVRFPSPLPSGGGHGIIMVSRFVDNLIPLV